MAWIVGLIFSAVLVTSASAQKLQAPKQIWQAMIAALSDVQDMTASLMVFDMKRIESTATELATREEFFSKIDQFPDAVKEGHAKVAKAAQELAEAAAFGDEQEVNTALGNVTAACTACHYDVRDKERRDKMQ
jgi:cytochrome c556